MELKYPGGDLALSTGVWILMGVACIWLGIHKGQMAWYLYAVIITACFALGIWFQIRSAGYAFMFVNILLAVIGTLGLLLNGVSVKPIVKIIGHVYCVWHSLDWARNLRR